MKDFFKEMFEYTHAMNGKLISELEGQSASFPAKSLELLNHTLNAQQIWNSRIDQKLVTCGVWEKRPAKDFSAINDSNYKNVLSILERFSLSQQVSYTNSKGETF